MVFDWITMILALAALGCAAGVWALTRPQDGPRRSSDYYAALVRRCPDDANTRYDYALALMRRGLLIESVAQLRMVTEADPRHAPAHHSLGLAMLSTGNSAAALVHLDAATKLNPMFADAFASLGALLLMRGDTIGAKAALSRAVTLDSSLAIAHLNLARCHLTEDEPNKAVDALREAINRDQAMRDEAKCGSEFDALCSHTDYRQLVYGG